MMDIAKTVRAFYDADVQQEWERLERHPAEFAINKRYINRYVRPGTHVLDMGGGPGRYALHLAAQGCEVTLADLSPGNVAFAKEKAQELSLPLRALCMDARDLSGLGGELFDAVLLMGPLYHLTQESDREEAVRQCLAHLRPGGCLFASFISSYAGVIYYLRTNPAEALAPQGEANMRYFLQDLPYAGPAFTEAFFIRQGDVVPFMERFALTTLHFLGSEGILMPAEPLLLGQPPEVLQHWIDVAAAVCERPDLLSFSEHFLYVGRKRG